MRQDQDQAKRHTTGAVLRPGVRLCFDPGDRFHGSDELSWHGILRGALVMMLLWWAWTGDAWLASVASAEERPIKLAILTGMAAMFVLALCIPEAFDDPARRLDRTRSAGRLLPALPNHALSHVFDYFSRGCRAAVDRCGGSPRASSRAALCCWWHRNSRDGYRQAYGCWRWWPTMWGQPWPASLAGGSRPQDISPRRHGLIIIVALGESFVAIDVGVAQEPISWVIVAASVLGLVLVSALWWAYFDVSALLGEHALATSRETRARLGRNAYSSRTYHCARHRLSRLRPKGGAVVRLRHQ